jgi:hypothetical protein
MDFKDKVSKVKILTKCEVGGGGQIEDTPYLYLIIAFQSCIGLSQCRKQFPV